MHSLTSGDLHLEVAYQLPAKIVEVWWRGTSDHRRPSAVLEPFFRGLLAEASAEGLTIAMHFETIEFFNSATIGSIVQLIVDARAAKVTLTLFYRATERWQASSFKAMSAFEKSDGLIQFRGI